MFSRMGTLVAAQEEMVQRIDTDVDSASHHISQGQSELLKLLHSLRGNRGLILKMFAIILIFVVFFILFLS